MKEEFLSRALAETYFQAAMSGRDMRRVADQLETLRASILEKNLYQAWRDVDRAVGTALLQENEELFDILDSFRKAFVGWAWEMIRQQVREIWKEDPVNGWEAFLQHYAGSLSHWRFQIYSELPGEFGVDEIPEQYLDFFLRILHTTPYMLESRWDQTFGLFLELAELPFITPEQRVNLLCSAGQIELYFFSRNEEARALFERARETEQKAGKAFARTEQSFGELWLAEWKMDEARNAFQKASMIDPQNEIALLYMGDTYKEEGRYNIAEAWYEDAKSIFPGSTDVQSRLIRLYEKRDYFRDHDPALIRKYVERIGRLLPIEKYTALTDAGFAFQSNDRFDEAEAWFREAIQLDPRRGNAWVNLGYVLEKKGQYEESEKAFKKALQFGPDYFDAQWGLAFLFESRESKEEDAIRTLETCLSLRPSWEVYILPRISELHWKTGRREQANAILFDCLRKFPAQDAEPLRILHERVNQLDEEPAMQLLEQIRQARGEAYADNFANRAGNVRFQYQKYEEAAEFYREAIRINASVPIYHYNLGLAMDRLDRLEEAEAAFANYLGLDQAPDADNLNSIGVFYYKKRQDNEKALGFYQRAIQANPHNDNYFYNQALVQEKLGQWSDAESSYRQAIECDPEDPENYNGLGVFYYGRQLHEQAVENYRKAIAIRSDEALYFSNLALACQALNKPEEELEAYRKAASLQPRYFLELGRALYTQGRHAEAVEAFEHGADYLPNFPFNYAYLSLALENTGQPERAWEALQRGLGKDPSLDDYFYNRMGVVLYRAGRYEEALQYYAEALKRAETAVYWENAGLAHEAAGQEKEAEEAYRKAMALEPANAQFPNRMGVFHYANQRHEQAAGYYRKALELDPQNAIFHHNLALALDGQGLWEEAEKEYLAAIGLDANNATFPSFLGVLYFKQARYGEAREQFEKAIQLDPANALNYENLGLTLEMLGGFDLAEKTFQQTMGIEPESPVFVNRMGLFYFNRGRFEDAAPWFRKASEMDPGNVLFISNLGLAYLEMGNPQEAAPCFRKALELKPGDEQITAWLNLAEAYLR
ncbi:MAG: tetratricopeptide repeat protein [Saprospiraceae bacterium]